MKKISFTWVVGVLLVMGGCGSDHVICDGRVVIKSKERIKFSKNEKPLLCGDKDIKEWKNVPLAQTEATMAEFLKGRGFYNPTFTLQNNQLHIDTGLSYRVKKVVFIGAPDDFDDVKFIGWKKEHFTSGTLNDIEGYTIRRLKELGYACAQVKLQAIIDTQVVEVYIQPGGKYVFPAVTYDESVKVDPQILERFFAFEPGDVFNENLLTLTSRRIEADAVVSKSNFLTSCENDILAIEHRINAGTSSLVQVGAGISTEEFPIVKASWKDSRIGRKASILSAEMYASHLRQVLWLGYEWHGFSKSNRWYIKPTIEVQRVDESDQEYYNIMAYTPVGVKLDFQPFHVEIQSGPAGDFEDAQEGPTTGQKEFGLWRNSVSVNTHNYEVFMNEPRRGGRFELETSSVVLSSVNNVNAHWVNLTGTQLWNLFNFGPPKYVFGIRFGIESVLTTSDGNVTDFLPQSYFSWLGGDMNLRGFDRQELPFDSLGALSTAYANAEIRFASLFADHFDPFVFTDFGLIGDVNYKFDRPLFWSPGVGLRWQSFIGVIRGTVAHGFITGPGNLNNEHFQYFVSLGREF